MSTVLIIDDSKDNASLIEASLSVSGYDILCAYTAEDGFDLAVAHHPDLIVTDLRLYGSSIDGWELIAHLRGQNVTRHTPIIATSVEVMPDDRQRALDAGCDIYFPKPFRIGELRAEINRMIG